jgi:hypothetical protein
MDLVEIGWGCVDWSYLAQHIDQWWAVWSMVINLWDQRNVGHFLSE